MRESLPRSAAGKHNPWLITVVASIATFMEVLDTTVANVSIRHIAASMGVSHSEALWVLTSYIVANALILPVSGWLIPWVVSVIIWVAWHYLPYLPFCAVWLPRLVQRLGEF
ncbi:hypothetical protein P8F52_001806 [Salmonella enterica]|nr:hypothetical protein [Salmonella enterica]